MHLWRRSYDVPPPGGESLKDTVARALPYYCQNILPAVLRGERVLVAAHGNSLRALVMVLDRLTPETIPSMELATGVPLVYRLKAEFDRRVEGRSRVRESDSAATKPFGRRARSARFRHQPASEIISLTASFMERIDAASGRDPTRARLNLFAR